MSIPRMTIKNSFTVGRSADIPVMTVSDLIVKGTISIAGQINSRDLELINSELSVSGDICTESNCIVGSDLAVEGTLNVGMDSILQADLMVASDLVVKGNLFTAKDTMLGSNVIISSDLVVKGSTYVNSKGVFNDDVTMASDLRILGDLDLSGNLHINSSKGIIYLGETHTQNEQNNNSSAGCITVTQSIEPRAKKKICIKNCLVKESTIICLTLQAISQDEIPLRYSLLNVENGSFEVILYNDTETVSQSPIRIYFTLIQTDK